MGLSHDGTSTVGYYEGHGDWAPIMGECGAWLLMLCACDLQATSAARGLLASLAVSPLHEEHGCSLTQTLFMRDDMHFATKLSVCYIPAEAARRSPPTRALTTHCAPAGVGYSKPITQFSKVGRLYEEVQSAALTAIGATRCMCQHSAPIVLRAPPLLPVAGRVQRRLYDAGAGWGRAHFSCWQ